METERFFQLATHLSEFGSAIAFTLLLPDSSFSPASGIQSSAVSHPKLSQITGRIAVKAFLIVSDADRMRVVTY